MTELKQLWARIEKKVIYTSLFLFLLRALLAKVFPSSSYFADKHVELILIGIVLLTIFRYIDEKLKTLDEPVLKISNKFLDGLKEILCEEKYYENVDIIAHTGVLYVNGILRECDTRIKNLRVLVRDTDSIEKISLPVEKEDKCKLHTEWRHAKTEWQLLKGNMLLDTPRITSLCIRCYPFDPMMTFIIIDQKKAYFDLMTPQIDFPGSTSAHDRTSYTVTDRTEAGRRLINNMSIVFNHMWNDFTKEVDLTKHPLKLLP